MTINTFRDLSTLTLSELQAEKETILSGNCDDVEKQVLDLRVVYIEDMIEQIKGHKYYYNASPVEDRDSYSWNYLIGG
jgi:hypothetical protein